MADRGAFGNDQADTGRCATTIVFNDFEFGTPPGENERVIGAMTTRVGNSRAPRWNGLNRA